MRAYLVALEVDYMLALTADCTAAFHHRFINGKQGFRRILWQKLFSVVGVVAHISAVKSEKMICRAERCDIAEKLGHIEYIVRNGRIELHSAGADHMKRLGVNRRSAGIAEKSVAENRLQFRHRRIFKFSCVLSCEYHYLLLNQK